MFGSSARKVRKRKTRSHQFSNAAAEVLEARRLLTAAPEIANLTVEVIDIDTVRISGEAYSDSPDGVELLLDVNADGVLEDFTMVDGTGAFSVELSTAGFGNPENLEIGIYATAIDDGVYSDSVDNSVFVDMTPVDATSSDPDTDDSPVETAIAPAVTDVNHHYVDSYIFISGTVNDNSYESAVFHFTGALEGLAVPITANGSFSLTIHEAEIDSIVGGYVVDGDGNESVPITFNILPD